MKWFYHIVLMLAATALTSGCIKESLDDCDNVTIYFRYLADGNEDVLSQYMSKVDLYVFDESGHILGSGNYTESQLKKFEAVPSFRLTAGKRYKVVAVGNAYDATRVVNLHATDFDNIFLQHPNWGNGDEVTAHDHNYLGQHEFIMPERDGVMYRDTVTLYSAHIDVDIRVTGLNAPSSGRNTRQAEEIPYVLSIENSNAQTTFNNEINEDEKGTIYPDLYYDAENRCFRTDNLALFRMDSGGTLDENLCGHEVVLRDRAGTEMYRHALYDYITDNNLEDDVTKQEAFLPLEIQFSSMSVSIKVPDWYIEDITPGYE